MGAMIQLANSVLDFLLLGSERSRPILASVPFWDAPVCFGCGTCIENCITRRRASGVVQTEVGVFPS